MFPNPANYFLATPEEFEREVTALTFDLLASINLDLASSLEDDRIYPFASQVMSREFDAWTISLKDGELIALMQWIVERFAYLHQQKRLMADPTPEAIATT